MNSAILFTEKQKFNQWWLWIILIGVNALFLFGVFMQLWVGKSFGNKPLSDVGLIITTVLVLLFTLFFFCLKLETIIRTDGIYVRFFPFHRRFKVFFWDELAKAYLRQYDPISEYGGWGLRLGLFGKGRAYNVSGDVGLQLEFMDKTRLLIGTNEPKELQAVIRQFKPIHSGDELE